MNELLKGGHFLRMEQRLRSQEIFLFYIKLKFITVHKRTQSLNPLAKRILSTN